MLHPTLRHERDARKENKKNGILFGKDRPSSDEVKDLTDSDQIWCNKQHEDFVRGWMASEQFNPPRYKEP